MEDVKKKPKFTSEQAEQIAAQMFAIYGSASTLPSERDQNFLIETPGCDYVLKIANPDTPLAVLELETRRSGSPMQSMILKVPKSSSRWTTFLSFP